MQPAIFFSDLDLTFIAIILDISNFSSNLLSIPLFIKIKLTLSDSIKLNISSAQDIFLSLFFPFSPSLFLSFLSLFFSFLVMSIKGSLISCSFKSKLSINILVFSRFIPLILEKALFVIAKPLIISDLN